jgi:hypothetical protein
MSEIVIYIDVNLLANKNLKEICWKIQEKNGFSRCMAHPTTKSVGFQNPETKVV